MGAQRHLSWSRTTALIVLLAVVTLLASACTQAPVGRPPSATASDTGARVSEAGQVTVAVSWPGPAAGARFGVAIDTHSVDLDAIDLTRQAVLRTAAGEVAPTSWAAPKAGHHRSGELVFPQVLSDGRPAIAAGSVELVIRDVGGIPERVFSWQA